MKIIKTNWTNKKELKELVLEALKTSPDAFSVTHDEYANGSDSWWDEFLSPYALGLEKELFFCHEEGETVGMASIAYSRKEKSSHVALLTWVYCKPEVRGRGYGKALVKHIISIAKKKGTIEKISLQVTERQKAAIALYTKLGFGLTGIQKNHLKDKNGYCDVYTMECILQY